MKESDPIEGEAEKLREHGKAKSWKGEVERENREV